MINIYLIFSAMTVMAKLKGKPKKLKKGKKEFKLTGKRGRLIVRNLPFKVI